jgi:hypothetical protein
MRKGRLLALLAVVAFIAVAALPAKHAVADERDFQFINNSNVTIIELYVSPSGESDWGDDILGSGTLEPGGSGTVHFNRFSAGNCLYDIRVVAEDGSSSELYQVDLCSTDTVTYG